MRQIFKKDKGEEHNFWMSYTDLLSGFLVVFIIATIIYQHEQNKIYGVIKENGFDKVEDVINMVNDYKLKGNLTNINDQFKDVFDSLEIQAVEFDSVEKSIRFYPTYESRKDSILFETDEDRMEYNLKQRIKKIGRPFVRKAMEMKNVYPNMEIRIEGHTDTEVSFMYNLDLSSRRAYSVYKCIHNECGLTKEELEFVERQMISVGYSYAKPIDIDGKINPDGMIDLDKSRRIEFRIISK